MIKVGTMLKIIDNCGGRRVKCIKLFNKSPRSFATVGDIILISLKTLRRVIKKRKVKKNSLYLAIIVGTAKEVKRKTGISLKSLDNNVVLINKEKMLIGKRIRGNVFSELRKKGFSRIASIAESVI